MSGPDRPPSHVTDSRVLGRSFGSAEMAALFTDAARVQAWLDVEAALAQAQAELGLIPAAAAAEIARQARVEHLDLDALGAEAARVGHALIPTIRALATRCRDGAGEWVHHGATTQDVVDTGLVLQTRGAWALVARDVRALRERLAALARRHARTVMAGRTHGQQALPVTLGYKLAVWVDELDRHLERYAEAEKRLLVGCLAGAVGTLAGFGPRGLEVQGRALRRLGLGVPRIAWHAARDRTAEAAMLLVQIAATGGKIAQEVVNLQRSEIDELREPAGPGRVGSSTMPHKQNPSTAELVVALARLVRGTLVPLTDALFVAHERDATAWRIEWAALPEAFVYTGALLGHLRRVADGLDVRPGRMAENLGRLGGLLLSERVMLALGERIGTRTAHAVVHEVAARADAEGMPFAQALAADPRVAPHLGPEAIARLLDPAEYLGLAPELVAAVVGPGPAA